LPQHRLKIGLIGCGVIAQVMHLHFLAELSDRFEVAALCDLSPELGEACARRHHVPLVFHDWRGLIAAPLDAVMILTSGSHAEIAIAAAQAGKHVFVEKPLCFSLAEGRAMIAAAEAAKIVMLVGYNKRYDAAYLRLQERMADLDDLRMVRVTTFESPFEPYIAHFPMETGAPPPEQVLAPLRLDSEARLQAAVGGDQASQLLYHTMLLDSMVHELNALRGLLGEPDLVEFADLGRHGANVALRFGETRAIVNWIDLPGMARYKMEFAAFSPERRLTLSFPSPYLRNAPATFTEESGTSGSAESHSTSDLLSYEAGFKAELVHFHDCITRGAAPKTTATDALHDIVLCRSILMAHRHRVPVANPSQISEAVP
jgi:predicted dehydrogenase